MGKEPEFKVPELIKMFPVLWLARSAYRMVTGRTAQCPACAEQIRPAATVCPHCHRDLTG